MQNAVCQNKRSLLSVSQTSHMPLHPVGGSKRVELENSFLKYVLITCMIYATTCTLYKELQALLKIHNLEHRRYNLIIRMDVL